MREIEQISLTFFGPTSVTFSHDYAGSSLRKIVVWCIMWTSLVGLRIGSWLSRVGLSK